MNNLRLVLLGPPASGKGTQGRMMAKTYSLPITSSGEILKRECKLGSALGLKVDGLISLGKLVSDDLIIESVKNWLKSEAIEDKGFILDGTPRTLAQAIKLQELFEEQNAPLTHVFFLDLPFEIIQDRVRHRVVCDRCSRAYRMGWNGIDTNSNCPECGGMLERRKDDDPEALLKRMEEYKSKTEPLVEFYETVKLLRRIDASLSPQDTFASVCKYLDAF